MNKYLRFISDRKFRFHFLAAKGLYKYPSDEAFLRKKYRLSYGRPLNLESPTVFNEKLQWLKLNDHDPLYPQLADKYSTRRYIAERIGEEYLVPLVGGPWSSARQIDFDSLPNQFVLKCTHDSGSVIVCRDKSRFDAEGARKSLTKRLRRNYYYGDREWPYKDVPPRIIAEAYMHPDGGSPCPAGAASLSAAQLQREQGLLDYRFMCFNGRVRALFLYVGVIDQQGHTTENCYSNVYDREFRPLPVREEEPNYPIPIEKSENFEAMVALAERLSQGFPLLRVDQYNIDGRIKLGEMTLYHNGRLANIFDHPEWDEIFGSWIELPEERQAALLH